MNENTKLWDKLGKTDPAHTKQFKRGGGFSGTAIKPMWSYRRLTEEFGPCGTGWGVNEPVFQVVQGDNREVLVYCTVSGWYMWEGERKAVYGVGGDKVVTHIKANTQYNRPERWENDDEAFKKAFTDALTNAFKLIGVGADVHMGMFDDNKYVNTLREEFTGSQPTSTNAAPPPKSSAALKRSDANGEDAWDRLTKELYQDFLDCKTLDGLAKLRADYRAKARDARWPKAWLDALAGEFDQFEEGLVREMEKEPAE